MKPLFLLLATIFLHLPQAGAVEFQQTIERNITSPQQMQMVLGHDVYRSIPYEETYEEQVPYVVSEPYTEYEEYYDSEYRCHNEPKNEQRCAYERECRQVPYDHQVCENKEICEPDRTRERCEAERVCRPSGPPVCETVQECFTNSRGEQVCKERTRCREQGETCEDKQVCRPETTPGRCHYENQCHNERDYREECNQEYRCRTERVDHEVCGYEQVRKVREVTKYRNVTRYRTETKCCVTKYRYEFDHTWEVQVKVQFPNDTILMAEELEHLSIEVDTNEKQPKATVEVLDSVFGYRVKKQTFQNKAIDIQLERVPKYTASQLGEKTIGELEVNRQQIGTEIVFIDEGIKSRVSTQYSIKIVNAETNELIVEKTFVASSSEEQKLKFDETLAEDQDYKIALRVQRQGPLVLDKNIDFKTENISKFVRWNKDDFSERSIINFNAVTSEVGVDLSWIDNAHRNEVQTKYVINAYANQQNIFNSEVSANDLLLGTKEGKISIPVAVDLRGTEIQVSLQVIRASRRLSGRIDFMKEKVVLFKVEMAQFKDESKIQNFFVVEKDGAFVFGFKDLSDLKIQSVSTMYEIKVWVNKGIFGKDVVYINDTFMRNVLQITEKGNYVFGMPNAFKEDVRQGKKVYFEVRISREHPSWNEKVNLMKSGTLKKP